MAVPASSLPPPHAFGLPYPEWRPDQVAALSIMLDSPHRVVLCNMPTGSGKTLAYIAAGVLGGGRTVFLTATKGLQDQIQEDFDGVVGDIRGQQGYPCKALLPGGEHYGLADTGSGKAPTCDHGPCHSALACTLREAGCDYYDRHRIALGERLLSTNYACWIAQRRYSQGLGSVDTLVLDEAHAAEGELAGALDIQLDKWLLGAVGVPTVPTPGAGLGLWRDWGAYWGGRLRQQLEGLPVPHSGAEAKLRRRMRAVERQMAALARMELGNWIENHTQDSWVFSVLNPAAYAEELLFQGARKVILVSATVTPKVLGFLGLSSTPATYWECPSRFPVARRPVTYIPTCRVDSRMTQDDVQRLVTRVDQIISPRKHLKGIIHTVSYKRRDTVLALSSHSSLMTTHGPGEMSARVGWWKKKQGGGVLVSPSLVTGWDFPGDQCRYMIILKLPFPDTRNPVLKARCELDSEYLAYVTMQSLVQAVGRGMRAADDWCEVFIVDSHWEWFISKYRKLAPQWFLEAVRRSLTIPQPLKLTGG